MSNTNTKPQQTGAASVKLSRCEIEVLKLVWNGLSNEIISVQLFISKRTVESHLCNIYDKLQVTNRLQACRRAAQLGMI